ncbi:MAG: DNA adenine methylase [Firmicutes bacterium HGW-Firmicutes-7]|nr:MAG: DNA adenine methylase [Firmicutes bacterium HGW-Firmicutes-7]
MGLIINELSTEIKVNKGRPILKWVGGKSQMMGILLSEMPKTFNKYIEPFIGGGALFFELQHKDSVISDSNPELINMYKMISSNVEEVIEELKKYQNNEEFYYWIRGLDVDSLSLIQRAARMLYLNKTCFNGLYRVNKKGEFNVPFGRYTNPNICDENNLRSASQLLKNTTIAEGDYKGILSNHAQKGDFIFLDPPYLPIDKYADFKRYTKEQFYEEDQIELANEVHRLYDLGCNVLLTNSNHPMVHRLYDKYDISLYNTKRFVNSDASKRTGQDVLVKAIQKRKVMMVKESMVISKQVEKYPSTRFMGSKQKLIQQIWTEASMFHFDSAVDLFSGSGIVSYMLKSMGKEVKSNDYMNYCANTTTALVENNNTLLSEADVKFLITPSEGIDYFVSNTFAELYFNSEDNYFIDIVRNNIKKMKGRIKRSLAMAALTRACLKKRPRGIFTYTGFRYDDGRKDLQITLQEQFLNAVQQINAAVFDNGKTNKSRNGDAMTYRGKADLVYMDPPYYSPLSDNEYVRRYHFLEGLARDWKDVEVQESTKTKKIKNFPTPFSSEIGANDAFDKLFRIHKDSILMISYSSNSKPEKNEILDMLSNYKKNVDVISINYKYSFGNQGNKVGDNRNDVEEYLFLGY